MSDYPKDAAKVKQHRVVAGSVDGLWMPCRGEGCYCEIPPPEPARREFRLIVEWIQWGVDKKGKVVRD